MYEVYLAIPATQLPSFYGGGAPGAQLRAKDLRTINCDRVRCERALDSAEANRR